MGIVIGALLVLGILGLVFGIVLAVASKIFHVEVDARIAQINEILPGANCGGCGYPGCMGYAEAVVLEGAEATMCSPGGSDVSAGIAKILGIEVEAGVRKFPIMRCKGREAVIAFEYDGIPTCKAAGLIQGGFKQCTSGCLGLGDCSAVCPVGAISMDGIAVIDENLCISCGKCAAACPRNIIEMRPEDKHVHVACLNREKGKAAKTACPTACIGCKKCEKECPFDAIHVENNLAIIDYDKCTNCGKCAKVCPMEVIENMRKDRKARKKQQEEKEKEHETANV